jgi:hypothetical protein
MPLEICSATRAVLASGPASTTARSISPTRPVGGEMVFRFVSPRLVFEVLKAGLDDDPAPLDLREDSL